MLPTGNSYVVELLEPDSLSLELPELTELSELLEELELPDLPEESYDEDSVWQLSGLIPDKDDVVVFVPVAVPFGVCGEELVTEPFPLTLLRFGVVMATSPNISQVQICWMKNVTNLKSS